MTLLSASGTAELASADDRGSVDDGDRVRRGLDIAPVPLNLKGKDARKVARNRQQPRAHVEQEQIQRIKHYR